MLTNRIRNLCQELSAISKFYFFCMLSCKFSHCWTCMHAHCTERIEAFQFTCNRWIDNKFEIHWFRRYTWLDWTIRNPFVFTASDRHRCDIIDGICSRTQNKMMWNAVQKKFVCMIVKLVWVCSAPVSRMLQKWCNSIFCSSFFLRWVVMSFSFLHKYFNFQFVNRFRNLSSVNCEYFTSLQAP